MESFEQSLELLVRVSDLRIVQVFQEADVVLGELVKGISDRQSFEPLRVQGSEIGEGSAVARVRNVRERPPRVVSMDVVAV